jgi:hypothetical protein
MGISTHEGLPTIRRTGVYIRGAENMSEEEILDRAYEISKTLLAERELL